MSEHREAIARERQARREKLVAAHKAELEAAQAEAKEAEAEFHDEGYDETQPGQVEVVAGTPEHVRELSAYPNASSYGPDVNVVLPPEVDPDAPGAGGAPTVVDVPFVSQAGATLNCTMGNWTGEPTSYSYAWTVGGVAVPGDAQLSVSADDVGQAATCVVTATNAAGSTAAPPSNSVVVE